MCVWGGVVGYRSASTAYSHVFIALFVIYVMYVDFTSTFSD